MKALVYHGPGKRSWEDKPKPTLKDPGDAIVRMTRTTICGTDLHILKGDVPAVTDGRILGHEGVGVVEEVGPAVADLHKGDPVLISCISSCARCPACRKGMYSHCSKGGGWVLGHLIDGTQAEYVRIPFADTSLYRFPDRADQDALVMLSDILPTGFECGVLNGQVKPADTVAIVGAGPVGLAALLTSKLYSPNELMVVDLDPSRLEVARKFGATRAISARGNPVREVMEATNGRGVDVAIEAVGIPSTFEMCTDMVAAGGHVANVGVHGKSVTLKLEKLWSHNITITTRLVDAVTTPMLLESVLAKRLDARALITHEFKLGQMMDAYDTFGDAAAAKALKVLLRA